MGRHTYIIEKLSGSEEHFGVRSSKELSLVNNSAAMALLCHLTQVIRGFLTDVLTLSVCGAGNWREASRLLLMKLTAVVMHFAVL